MNCVEKPFEIAILRARRNLDTTHIFNAANEILWAEIYIHNTDLCSTSIDMEYCVYDCH